MLYEKFPLQPLPPDANQYCPHCGEQSYLTKFQNIVSGEIITVIICVNQHAFTVDMDDTDYTISQWNQRV